MAALSDYLESQLLNHLFRDESFPKPTTIALALTSKVPLDSDDGTTLPELPSGIDGLSTNYKRIDLGNPSDTTWTQAGVSNNTAFAVYYPTDDVNTSGYYYPLYLRESDAQAESSNGNANAYTFDEFPSVTLYAPASSQQTAQESNPGYTLYEGNGFIQNKSQIIFNPAHTDWGWVSGIAILDSSEYGSGNMLMYSQLTNPRFVYTGDNLKFDVQSLEICLK
jgi:hypothetical protein